MRQVQRDQCFLLLFFFFLWRGEFGLISFHLCKPWSRNYSLLSPLCSMFSPIKYCAERCITKQVTHDRHPRICLWAHDVLQLKKIKNKKLMWLWTNIHTFQHKNDHKVQACTYAWKKKKLNRTISQQNKTWFLPNQSLPGFSRTRKHTPTGFSLLNSPLCPLSLSGFIWWSHSAHNS